MEFGMDLWVGTALGLEPDPRTGRRAAARTLRGHPEHRQPGWEQRGIPVRRPWGSLDLNSWQADALVSFDPRSDVPERLFSWVRPIRHGLHHNRG